jgi:FkbM family methyltransferase
MIRSWLLSVLQRFPTIYAGLRGAHSYREVSRKSTPTPFGFNFAGPNAMKNGEFEPDETGQLRDLLESADVFVNVGANVGYYVCHARHLGKKVVAIEPLEQNVQLLQRNLLANGWRDVEVFPLALGDRIGLEPLYGGGTAASLVSGWAGSSPRHFRMVPVTTLDNLLGDRFVGERILFLIDVEGFELPVLRGAIRQFTHRPAPAWFIEICIDEHQPGETQINPDLVSTFEVFWEHGYAAARAGCESGHVTRDDVERWAMGRDLPATHNFLFTFTE